MYTNNSTEKNNDELREFKGISASKDHKINDEN